MKNVPLLAKNAVWGTDKNRGELEVVNKLNNSRLASRLSICLY